MTEEPAGMPNDGIFTASGIILQAPAGSILFLKRGDGGDFPGFWAFPGGKVEDGETLYQAAARETQEETGYLVKDELGKPLCRRVKDGSDFTTYVANVEAEFVPTLCDESAAYAWAPADSPPEPLHPGCAVALARATMNELGVARAMAAGDLVSPQRYESMSLHDMRLTGTGVSYRSGLDEHVFRRPEVYLNQDFLDRCAGLPVIWVHPPNNILDSAEYAKRVIGAVMFAYIKGDEVWAICRVYDDEAIEKMEADHLSTSPAVVFRNPSVNTKLEAENGSKILIEGDPSYLDHLAVVSLGVWDKGGEPSGIRADAQPTESTMPEEKKPVEDAKADGAENIKELIVGLADSFNKKFDALNSRMDSFDADKIEKKADAARKDNEGKEAGDEGKDEDVKAAEVAADKARKDAEDAKEEAKEAKADAAALTKRLADLESRMPKPMADADYNAMADAQARADSIFSSLGKRAAPRPLDGETPGIYRRRLARELKAHSKDWKDTDLNAIDDNTFGTIENKIYADAATYATRPDDLGANELRMITEKSDTGHTVHRFVGKTSFVAGMMPPARVGRLRHPSEVRH